MNHLLNNRNITIINFGIISYFLFIFLCYHYKIEHVLIGVIREVLTIPLLLSQIICLAISINFLFKHKKRPLFIISTLCLAICTVITMSSLF